MTPLLGSVIVLTDRAQAVTAGHDLPTVVAAAASGGAGAVVLREKDLPDDQRLALGIEVARALDGTSTHLIVASDMTLAANLDAHGIHLARRDEPARPSALVVGRSCHTAAELAAATHEQADYVTLSPVFASASKPGHGPPLGPGGAMDLVTSDQPTPCVYALGGVTAVNAPECLSAGFAGVAVMGAVMAAPEPEQAVIALVAAVATADEVAR